MATGGWHAMQNLLTAQSWITESECPAQAETPSNGAPVWQDRVNIRRGEPLYKDYCGVPCDANPAAAAPDGSRRGATVGKGSSGRLDHDR
jgi:hypothetical protein